MTIAQIHILNSTTRRPSIRVDIPSILAAARNHKLLDRDSILQDAVISVLSSKFQAASMCLLSTGGGPAPWSPFYLGRQGRSVQGIAGIAGWYSCVCSG